MRWTRAGNRWGRGAAALAIAYLLVLHAVVGGLALGSHAAMAAVDASICNPASAHAEAGDPAGERHPPPSQCCVLGCVAPTVLGPAKEVASVLRSSLATLEPVLREARGISSDSPQRAAHAPRAPPA